MPHVASHSDFLLARLAGGNISLREITGCVTVGQQHPVQQVWTPGSEQAVAYERARIKVRGLVGTRSGGGSGPHGQPAAVASCSLAAVAYIEIHWEIYWDPVHSAQGAEVMGSVLHKLACGHSHGVCCWIWWTAGSCSQLQFGCCGMHCNSRCDPLQQCFMLQTAPARPRTHKQGMRICTGLHSQAFNTPRLCAVCAICCAQAYILRSLKNQAERSKAVKAGKAVPCVSLQELQRVCRGMAIVNNPTELPTLLAEYVLSDPCCHSSLHVVTLVV